MKNKNCSNDNYCYSREDLKIIFCTVIKKKLFQQNSGSYKMGLKIVSKQIYNTV